MVKEDAHGQYGNPIDYADHAASAPTQPDRCPAGTSAWCLGADGAALHYDAGGDRSIYAERGPYGGYALVRGHKMPPLIFTLRKRTFLEVNTFLL